MLEEIWVRDCMTADVISCSFDTSLEEVVAELKDRLFSCLVVAENNEPIGIITERDLVSIFSTLLGKADWSQLKVCDYMTKPARTLYEDLTLLEAVDQMRLDKIRHAPIVDQQNQLVGILTQSDIIRGFRRTFGELGQTT
ncbi:CBS domain-containing protein [Aurantivibrio plasticivorans]